MSTARKGIIDPKGNLAGGRDTNRDLTPPFNDYHLLRNLFTSKPRKTVRKNSIRIVVNSKTFDKVKYLVRNGYLDYPDKLIKEAKLQSRK